MDMTPPEDRLISWQELARLLPYSRQHIFRLERAGQFPRRVKLGARRIAWWLPEITQWMRSRSRSE